jgi:hypothetical protein
MLSRSRIVLAHGKFDRRRALISRRDYMLSSYIHTLGFEKLLIAPFV